MDNDTTDTPKVVTLTTSQWEDRELDRRERIKTLFRLPAHGGDVAAVERLRQRCLDDPRMDPDTARTELYTLIASSGGPHESLAREAPPSDSFNDILAGDYRRALGVTSREVREYSVTNLIQRMCDPKSTVGGYELEVSQGIEAKGYKAKHGGVIIPLGLEMGRGHGTRTLTAGGGGASLVGVEHLSGSFIDVIRERSVTLSLGATQLRGLVQNVSIPRKTAPASVAWLTLDGTDAITPADATFDSIAMSPTQLAGISAYSHLMLRQGLPETEQMVRMDLAGTVAAGIDKALLNGSGVGAEPAGISQTAGAKNTHTAAAPTYAQIVALRQAVFTAGADIFGGLAYVAHPGLLTQLESVQKFTSEGEAISEQALDGGEFRINGVRGLYSANQASNSITFGAWSECIVGWWGPGVEIVVDPNFDFARGSQAVRIIADAATDVRHAGSFAISTPV